MPLRLPFLSRNLIWFKQPLTSPALRPSLKTHTPPTLQPQAPGNRTEPNPQSTDHSLRNPLLPHHRRRNPLKSPLFGYYWLFAIPTTLLILLIWYFWWHPKILQESIQKPLEEAMVSRDRIAIEGSVAVDMGPAPSSPASLGT